MWPDICVTIMLFTSSRNIKMVGHWLILFILDDDSHFMTGKFTSIKILKLRTILKLLLVLKKRY